MLVNVKVLLRERIYIQYSLYISNSILLLSSCVVIYSYNVIFPRMHLTTLLLQRAKYITLICFIIAIYYYSTWKLPFGNHNRNLV